MPKTGSDFKLKIHCPGYKVLELDKSLFTKVNIIKGTQLKPRQRLIDESGDGIRIVKSIDCSWISADYGLTLIIEGDNKEIMPWAFDWIEQADTNNEKEKGKCRCDILVLISKGCQCGGS